MFPGGRPERADAPVARVPGVATALDRWGDLLCELLVRLLGTWTVLYHLALVLDVRTTPLLALTVVLTVLPLVVPWGVRARRARRASAATRGPADATGPVVAADAAAGPADAAAAPADPGVDHTVAAERVRRLPGALLVAVPLAVGAVWAMTGADASYELGWVLAVAAVGVLVVALVVQGPSAEQATQPLPTLARWGASLLVLGVLATAAVASLYTLTKSYDDVFYVNKTVFVAEHGTIPVRDTIYSDQVLPAVRGAGSVPVQSFEVLQGAVAHVLGVSGGDAAYLGATPIAVALAVWVLWWLAREWSRGPAIAAFVVAAAYLAWGIYLAPGSGGSIAVSSLVMRGSWQGKIVLACVALPFCHLALTRWSRHRRPRDLWLLFLVGAGAVGLASTAIFLVPPVAVTAVVALAVTRRRGWWGPLALAAYPVGAGLVVSRLSQGESYGELLRNAPQAFHGLYGQGGWGWLGGLALLLGAWAVRRGGGQVVAAAVATATVVVLAPFAPRLVDDLTGAGPVVWRLGWIAPLPVLLGVLAAAPLGSPDVLGDRARRVVARVPTGVRMTMGWLVVAATFACVVLAGRPVWEPGGPPHWLDRPSWKWTSPDLVVARAIAAGTTGPGPVLAPREAMSALALVTTRVHAVDPRSFFLQGLVEDPVQHAARKRLSYAMSPGLKWVYRSFPSDLRVLGVRTVCLDPTQVAARRSIEDARWVLDSALDVPGLTCWRPPAAG